MAKIKRLLLIICGFLFFCSAYLFAAVKDDPIMIKGIRPMGMGGAFTAVADDENSIFYNPAGIAQRTGWLLQIFNINAAINKNTVDAGKDLSDVLSNLSEDDSNSKKIDDLITIKDAIADRDIDIMMSLANPAFISSPISVGANGNSLSFGVGLFNSLSMGIRAGMKIPRFALDVVKLVAENRDDKNAYVSAIPDNWLSMTDILQPGTTPAQIREDINSGKDWSYISTNYLANDFINLIDALAAIAADTSLGDGDKYTQVVAQLHDFVNGTGGYVNPHDLHWSVDDTNLKATVNAYITATLDIPIAYKIKSLEPLRIPGELSVGANIKYIQRAKFTQTVIICNPEIAKLLNGESIEDVIDTKAGAAYGQGFGIDLGMLYSLTPRWHFGLQVSDIFTNINYDKGYSINTDKYPDEDFTHNAYIASQVNIGASHIPESILGWNTKNRLLLAADIRDIFGSYEDSFQNKLHIGAEFRLACLALRAGLSKLRPTVGLGLEFEGFQLSYAYYGEESYLAKALGDSDKTVYYHEFLLAVKIGRNKGRKVLENKKTLQTEENKNVPVEENKITTEDENKEISETSSDEENKTVQSEESKESSEENIDHGEQK